MSALLRLLTRILEVAALAFLTRRRRLTHTLTRAEATAADHAIPLETSGLSAWWLRRLGAAGVIKQTPAGLYWLDPVAYSSYRRVRLVRVAIVLGLAFGAWTIWTLTNVRR